MIASKLCRDGQVLTLARQNLRRWMARDDRNVRPVFQEWHRIFTRLSRAELAEYLHPKNRPEMSNLSSMPCDYVPAFRGDEALAKSKTQSGREV